MTQSRHSTCRGRRRSLRSFRLPRQVKWTKVGHFKLPEVVHLNLPLTVVIRMRIGTNVHVRHAVIRRLLQLAAGKCAGGVTIEQQRQHHARVIRLRTPPLIDRHQRAHIQPLDHVDHEPSQMVLRQMILNTGREQMGRIAVHGNEFNGPSGSLLGHGILLGHSTRFAELSPTDS